MADNITLPGTGLVVATDEISSVHHPYTKLELGAAGAATVIAPGQQLMAASIPAVIASDQTPVPTGNKMVLVNVTPTLSVSGTYASGDYVGVSGSPSEIAGAVRSAGGTGTLEGALVIDGEVQMTSLEIWLFDTDITTPTDNAAWSITDAHARTCIGIIPITTFYASALNTVGPAKALGIRFKASGGTTSIYFAIVARCAPVYGAVMTPLTVRFMIKQD